MIIRVIDFETVGMKPPGVGFGICQVGYTDVAAVDGIATVGQAASVLVNPGCLIPPEASGIHDITNKMVEGALSAELVLPHVFDPVLKTFAAHNMRFDRQFWPADDRAWICTYKVAQRIWPNAPNYKNGTLRYWLDLPVEGRTHDAAVDTLISAHVLARILHDVEFDLDLLVQWSSEPTILRVCEFGKKHRGETWAAIADIDEGYLRWISDRADEAAARGEEPPFDEDVIFTARHHLNLKNQEQQGRLI